MDLRIRRLDPAESSDIEASYHVRAAADAHDLPDDPPRSWSGHVGRLVHPWPAYETPVWLADVGADTVGVLELQLPQQENRHRAFLEVHVQPEHRRRGVARTLHAWAVDFIRRAGRRQLTGDYVTGLPGGATRDPAFEAFADAVGAKAARPTVRRRLDLATVEASDWDSLLRSARPKTDGYSVVEWIGATPEELLEDVAALESRIISDAPSGDLEIEPEAVDAHRLRATEETLHLRGRRLFHAGARHDSSGRLVGWTVMTFDADTPSHAWQQTTIVDPGHRGHRLGILVKIANLNQTRSHEPAFRTVDTWNAAENAHMIPINEALGFRALDVWVDWQQDV